MVAVGGCHHKRGLLRSGLGIRAYPAGQQLQYRPILIGAHNLQRLGLVVDYRYQIVWSHETQDCVPVVLLESGHLAVDLRKVVAVE